MAIYARTGDKGETSLATGQRVSKRSPIIELVGALDELNSLLGVCVAHLGEIQREDFAPECEVLKDIQGDLFTVGAIVVGSKLSFNSAKEVENIEETIDDYEKLLPQLKNFVIPGGSVPSSYLHCARTVVRRLERQVVGLESKSILTFLPYLNRLSDLLFVMARYVCVKVCGKENFWMPKKM